MLDKHTSPSQAENYCHVETEFFFFLSVTAAADLQAGTSAEIVPAWAL